MKRMLLAILLGGMMLMSSCASSSPSSTPLPSGGTGSAENIEKNPQATIEMENGGKIVLELFFDKAPVSVRNFVSLAQSGFYNGTGFHRIIPGFMIQGGDPEGTGMGGPGYSIKGEFANNGVDTGISHTRGIISMARAGARTDEEDKLYYNTAGSQFFITVDDASFLDGKYAAFGKVLEGMDVADRIVSGKASGDLAVNPEKIKSVSIELFGQTIAAPETIPDKG